MQPAADCPDEADLAAFHRGDLPPVDIDRVADHVGHCASCEARLQAWESERNTVDVALARGPTPDAGPVDGVGTVIAGRYKLIEAIGEVGMGSVFMAQQVEPVRRLVAVKLIREGMDSRQVLARFEAERQALALMDHPNIAKVLDAGMTATGRPFFVMELVRGSPITAYCDDNMLTTRDRLDLFVAACRALQHAHQKGIIHRDIKPGNVLVGRYDGRPMVKVIDFGVAKAIGQPSTERTLVTDFGAIVGTPGDMSPEQARLDQVDVDTRSDVYSLGVLLYEILTGSTPLERGRLGRAALLEMLRLVREDEPQKPSTRHSSSTGLPSLAARRRVEPARLSALIRGDLDWTAMRALEKDRSRRYETANALARDVERHLADEAVEAGPPTARYRLGKLARRHRVVLVAASAFAALLLVAAVGGSALAMIAERARAEAVRAEDREKAARKAAQNAEAEMGRALARANEAEKKEGTAREAALKRLSQVEKGMNLIASIFADLNPDAESSQNKPLPKIIAERLVKVANQVEGQSVGDPSNVAMLQYSLGMALTNLGESVEEIAANAEPRRKLAKRLPPKPLDNVADRINLTEAYRLSGRPAEAVATGEGVIRDIGAARPPIGPEGRLALGMRLNLVAARSDAGQAADVVEEARTLAGIFARKSGDDHPDALISRVVLAEVGLAS